MTEDWKRELIEARLRQAEESFNDAILLLEKGGSIRAVLNRLYYSLFYAAVALLLDKGLTSKRHSGIISLFDITYTKEGSLPIWMSQLFHKLFDLRMESDYKVSRTPEREVVAKMAPKAQEFLNEIKNFLVSSADGP